MDVFSELKQAQLENLQGAEPAAGLPGHIYYKSPLEPIRISDGTDLHTVITDQNLTVSTHIAQLRSALYPVGEVKMAMLDETQFQSAYGINWVLMEGQSLSAATYTELAAARPNWVSGGNITIPNSNERFAKGVTAAALGALQAGETGDHLHYVPSTLGTTVGAGGTAIAAGGGVSSVASELTFDSGDLTNGVGHNGYPDNFSISFCIKIA
jgi:hypothetical protein